MARRVKVREEIRELQGNFGRQLEKLAHVQLNICKLNEIKQQNEQNTVQIQKIQNEIADKGKKIKINEQIIKERMGQLEDCRKRLESQNNDSKKIYQKCQIK